MLSRLLQASAALTERPPAELEPFKDDIKTLTTRFGALEARLAAVTSLSPSSTDSMSTIHGTPNNGLATEREMQQLLQRARQSFCSCRARIEQLKTYPKFDWFALDARLLHLNYITTVGRTRRLRAIELNERLLLLCSCMSFATEFSEFERRHGWYAKEDLLYDSLSHGISPGVQRLKKHTKGFFDELRIPKAEEQKLDMGLRLGTKLNVIEKIGRSCGLGSFLSLLLGFELSRAFRLPYDSIVGLVASITEQPDVFEPIRKLADAYSRWWEECQAEYAVRFGKGHHQNGRPRGISGATDVSQEESIPEFATGVKSTEEPISMAWTCGERSADSVELSYLFDEYAAGIGPEMTFYQTPIFHV